MADHKADTTKSASVMSDLEWMEQIFREHYVALCAFVLGYVTVDDVAEDIVQDLFLSVWANPERWRDRSRSPSILLYVAARNRALDYLKRRRVRERYARNVPLEQRHSAPTAIDDLTEKEIQKAVSDAVDNLPNRAREIFLMSRREGLTYRQIAEQLEISVKTVETQMSRSLRRLRTHMAPYL